MRNKLIFERQSNEFRSERVDVLFAVGYSVFSRVTFDSFAKSKLGTDIDVCKNSCIDENIVYKGVSANCRVLKDEQVVR